MNLYSFNNNSMFYTATIVKYSFLKLFYPLIFTIVFWDIKDYRENQAAALTSLFPRLRCIASPAMPCNMLSLPEMYLNYLVRMHTEQTHITQFL